MFTSRYTWKTWSPNENYPVGAWRTRSYSDPRTIASTTRPDRSRERKPTGWLYPKPYFVEATSYNPPRGRIEWKVPVTFSVPDPNRPGYTKLVSDFRREIQEGIFASAVDGGRRPMLMASSSNLRRSAEIKALSALKDQKVNLGVALAEAQQTADFIGTQFERIARSVRHARRGRYDRALESLSRPIDFRNVPRTWIEYQYALAPLLGDIHGSIEALRDRNKLDDWVVTVKGSASDSYRSRTALGSDDQEWRGQAWMDEMGTLGYFVRLDFVPNRFFLHHLSSLGVTNPLEILWEKVPFSFVVDWAIPIGEWFSTMDATLGYDFLSGSCSERKEATSKWSPRVARAPARVERGIVQFTGNARSFSLNRTIYGGPPIVGAPRVKNPLSIGHLANGLSLLAAAFDRKR